MELTKNLVPNFLDILTDGKTSLPQGALWLVQFEDLGSLIPGISQALNLQTTYNTPDRWTIENAAFNLLVPQYQDSAGCVFCAAIDMPGEELTVNAEGNIQSNAFIRSYASQGRTMFPKMRMSVLDTNVSFCDNFLRPWVVSTATWGLLGRQKEDPRNYRTNLYCWKLGNKDENSLKALIKWTFFDVCCVSVNNEEYNYNTVTSPILREAQFIYNSYSIDTAYNPFVN